MRKLLAGYPHVFCRLDLSYNSLPEDERGEMPEDQLYSLPHLRYLDLTNCSIRQLPLTAFVNNLELRELRSVVEC